ncbi:hypothetical protein EXIGLDRAFT_753802, partial [Exidia glandulosa HHB12029]
MQPCHGEVLDVFTHQQPGMPPSTFISFRPLKDYTPGLISKDWSFWKYYPQFDVEFWFPNQHGPVIVVPVERIECQLARITYRDPDIWMTIALQKHLIHLRGDEGS